jgi:ABC-type branched-subunit amino acid transport system ATPase component
MTAHPTTPHPGGRGSPRARSSGTPPAVEVDGLVKTYGSLRAVDRVSFTVNQGEFFGVLGPNGAGKTTTLELIEGLRQPDAGRFAYLVRIRGHATQGCCPASACSCKPAHSSTG